MRSTRTGGTGIIICCGFFGFRHGMLNAGSTVGKNCRIHPGVCIGANGGKPPRIGDNVYLGPGAKVFGDIELADGVMVGANAVVNHSCMEEGAHLVGIPAKAAESHRDECSHN